MEMYGGNLDFLNDMSPKDARKELLSIEGVGPKTADCVLLFSLGKDVIPVDTHVFRVVKRLGLAPQNADHEEVHKILMSLIPAGKRGAVHVALIMHGRKICKAQNPLHDKCFLIGLCDYARYIGAYKPEMKKGKN
jgi:endonuclease III